MASGTLALTGNYLLLDANRQAGDDLPRDNLIAALIQLNAAGIIASLEREFPKVAREEGTMMALAKRALEWEEKYTREGFEKGLRQGLERGEKRGVERGIERGRAQVLELGIAAERALLCRQAVRQFGAADAAALVRHLGGISDRDGLARIGERIVDCGTTAELLAWLDEERL